MSIDLVDVDPRDFEKFGNFLILFCLEKVG